MRTPEREQAQGGERIAKVMARAGLCSRRDAEKWIAAGRVSVNGETLSSPAVLVSPSDHVLVDGRPLPEKERTRLFLYHKPKGLVTTAHDPEGRPSLFDALPPDLPRLVAVGRLDINTEGLLLLTNDGGLARVLALPATGWLRRYRARAFGEAVPERLAALERGVEIDGVRYGPIHAGIDRKQGANVWLTLGLREGKNREVRRVLAHLGLAVNRLIRISFGPFQLGDLPVGGIKEVPSRVLREQLGRKLSAEASVDFDAPRRERSAAARQAPAEKRKRSQDVHARLLSGKSFPAQPGQGRRTERGGGRALPAAGPSGAGPARPRRQAETVSSVKDIPAPPGRSGRPARRPRPADKPGDGRKPTGRRSTGPQQASARPPRHPKPQGDSEKGCDLR